MATKSIFIFSTAAVLSLCLFSFNALGQSAFGQTGPSTSGASNPTGSDNMQRIPVKENVDCPAVGIDYPFFGSPPLTATSTPQALFFGNADCTDGNSGGGGGWGAGFIGLAFNPNCPADRPYLGGFNEGWGGNTYVGGGASMSARCCTGAQAPMSYNNSWKPGTKCN